MDGKSIVNLTPHDIVVAPDGTDRPRHTFKPAGPPLRCVNAVPDVLSSVHLEGGVTAQVVSEPRYTGLDGGELPTGDVAVLVSMEVARYLVSTDGRAQYPQAPALILTPDSSPEGAVRDARGQIVAVKRLCLWRRK
jgi:hypothetical protein